MRFRKEIALLLALCLILPILPLQAAAEEEVIVSGLHDFGPIEWKITADGTLTISGNKNMQGKEIYEWDDYRISITKVVVEDGITSIPERAFAQMPRLTEVYIGNTVKEIADEAFARCPELKAVHIPASTTVIRPSAFFECSSLAEVTFDEKIEALTIGAYAFAYTGVEALSFTEGVKQIEKNAFANNEKLTTLSFVEGLESMSIDVFAECPALTGHLYLPSSLTSIGRGSFDRGVPWTSVEINAAFQNCDFSGNTSLKTVKIGGAATIVAGVFENCTNLESVVLGPMVTKIYGSAFLGCTSLSQIILPEALVEIDGDAFRNTGLLEITIPEKVESILDAAFAGCTALTEIHFLGDAPEFTDMVGVFDGVTATAYYNPEKVGWTADVMWGHGGNITWIPIGHVHEYTAVVTPPTCTESGYTTYTCAACGTSYTDDVVEPVGHTWEDASELDKTCVVCGFVEEHTHTFTSVVTPPTCTESGSTTHTCSLCGSSYTDTAVDPVGHTWEDETAEKRTCTACGFTDDHAHEYTAVVTLPTCTTAGYTTHTCSVCGNIYTDTEVAPLGHTWEDETVVDRTCTVCGFTEMHTHQYNPTVTPPTCTEFGYITYTCTVCGLSYRENDAGALGHTWNEDPVLPRTCTVCGAMENCYRVTLDSKEVGSAKSAWIDGAEHPIIHEGSQCHVDIKADHASTLVIYTYNDADVEDIHTQYPTGMKVWLLNFHDGMYSGKYVNEFENLLQYSGSSIRITGNKGIRMITSITKENKATLTGKGLEGYTLLEYGTAICWARDLSGGKPMTLGQPYVRSNFAYRQGQTDPVFAYSGNLVQYTNVLVGFTLDQCKDDIAMRPYITLVNAEGHHITIYGGIVYRSIGYIAWQNRNVFKPNTAAYKYVWEIIHHVYGNKFDADYKG